MNRTHLVILSAALFLLFETDGFAGELQLLSPKVVNSKGVMELRATSVPSGDTQFLVGEPESKQTTKADVTPIATNLWVLLDSSTLCQSQKVDTYVTQMIHALKREAAPESYLTVVTYTSESVDFIVRKKTLEELEDFEVQCERRPYSISYDKPLARLLHEDMKSDLPTVAWVFTSGNIELSKSTAGLLASRNVELNLILYNEFIEKEIRPAVQSTVSLLSNQTFHFGLQPKAEAGINFPSMRYNARFPIRTKWQGTKTLLQLSMKSSVNSGSAVLAKNNFALVVPLENGLYLWIRYGRWIALCLLVSLVVYGIYRVVHYYLPRYCDQCRRRLSFKSPTCLFCAAKGAGVLIGNFRRRSDGFGGVSKDRSVVVPLLDNETQIGSHRRSPIRFATGRKRTCFARVLRQQLPSGQCVFQIVAEPAAGVDISVNGREVVRNRYLASGDEIVIDSSRMSFFYEEERL